MKKKILIIIKDYYPIASPSANLIIPLLNEMKNNYDIKVLARKSNDILKEREFIDNIEIIRFNDRFSRFDNRLKNKIKSSNNKIFNIIYFVKKSFFYLLRKLNLIGYSFYMVRKIEKNISQIVLREKIDYIIPITFEEIIASLKYTKKNNNINLVPYVLEQFLNENKKNIYAKIKLKKLKISLVHESKKIFVLPVLKGYFEEAKEKLIITEHPMIIDNVNKKNKNSVINITYAGGLDYNQRNPIGVLNILDKIKNKNKFKINFYSYGNCELILKNFEKKSGNYLESKGVVSNDIAHQILKQSNILITIGNKSSKVVPSKIFDCISTGKPIIHFYFHDEDPYINYLSRYKLSLCIKLDDKNNNQKAELIENFCFKNKNSVLEYKVFAEEFKECTPKYVANQFFLEIK